MAKPDLPVNVDATYGDDADPSVKLHQQHHDAIHTLVRMFDPVGTPQTGWIWGWNAAAGAFTMRAPAGAHGGVYNVKDYGAVGDGATDDTAAINSAIADMPVLPNSFSPAAASGNLHFPAGRYMSNGGHIIPNTKRIRVTGAGQYNTILYRRPGQTGDFLTFNAPNSGIENLTIDGGVNGAPGSGDGLVFNANYGYALNSQINNNGGNGLSIGKAGGSLLTRVEGTTLRLNRGYGIYVMAGSNTDCQFVNLDVGMSGLAGVRIAASGTLMAQVHSWGNGIEATANNDKVGFWIASNGSLLNGCVSETNLGHGILLAGATADGNGFTNCDSWGNVGTGLYSFGGNKWQTITGCKFRNNGVTNTTGLNNSGFANMLNEAGQEWSITGCVFNDDGLAHPAGANYGYTPSFPYPGRTAQRTVSRHYWETSTADLNILAANQWRSVNTRTGTANLLVGAGNVQTGNIT